MKYTKKIVDRITSLVESDDFTVAEICENVGISRVAYYSWLKDKPEFKTAIEEADQRRFELFKKEARKGLLKLLTGGEFEEVHTDYVDKDGKPRIKSQKKIKKVILPNPTAVIFTLKNVDPDNFADVYKNELSGKNGAEIPLAPIKVEFVNTEAKLASSEDEVDV